MADLHVTIAGVPFENPLIAASGTFGFGREYGEFFPLSVLGGVSCKGLTLRERMGNPPPRVAETPGGMLNAIGLQNPGAAHFIAHELPWLKNRGATVIVNIAGYTVEDYVAVAKLVDASEADMIELNISCPNVKKGGIAFGVDPAAVENVTRAVKDAVRKPLIVKLSPNVADITETARGAQAGGADALSLINTLLGMKLDIKTRRPVLANGTGGLSGPAILPVAVRMVWQVSRAVGLPIIGMGGVHDTESALELLMAGADAVAVGTAMFADPYTPVKIRDGIERFCRENGYATPAELKI